MNSDLPNNAVSFSHVACRIGELLAATAGVNPEHAATAAQWLLPLSGGRGAPETAEGLQFADHCDAEIRALAAAALRCPEALDLVTRWNAVTTPSEGPLRYLTRWTTAPAPAQGRDDERRRYTQHAHAPVIAEELAEIERLDREATPGPWAYDEEDDIVEMARGSSIAILTRAARPELTYVKPDGRAIAAYREAAPRLARDLTAERETSARLAARVLSLGHELEALRAAVRSHEAATVAARAADLDLWTATKG